jgi:hypothetical protein
MDKPKPTAESFTVKPGHPMLIFLCSVWMLLLGCTIGMHWWFRQLDLAPFDDLIWPHLFSAVLGKNSFIPVVVVAVEMW